MLKTILAPNPSPLTGPGTNTFLLGQAQVAVIDPGPQIGPQIGGEARAMLLEVVDDANEMMGGGVRMQAPFTIGVGTR